MLPSLYLFGNKFKEKKINETDILNNTPHKHKHRNYLNSPDTKRLFLSICNEFVKVQIDKARSIGITLIYKPFYKLLIAKEAGLGLITLLSVR